MGKLLKFPIEKKLTLEERIQRLYDKNEKVDEVEILDKYYQGRIENLKKKIKELEDFADTLNEEGITHD